MFYVRICLSEYILRKERSNMKKCRWLLIVPILFSVILCSSSISLAHGHHGNGHHNNYYSGHTYYCYGHAAHAHSNGTCPYYSQCTATQKKYYGASTVKKVQKKLTSRGYSCGKADGIYDAGTRTAIKKFQKKKGLSVNGKINKTLLNKLNISI